MKISIDTRTLQLGDIFVPVKGQNFDGHDFIQEALAKGAAKVLDEDLMVLAKNYRQEITARVIAVTGSTGKTTTKDMIASILAQQGQVKKTSANYNNEIGLPLTILETDKDDKFLVVELAMRGLGQIRRLAEIARPDIAVITNTGLTHLELLETRDNIARAKAEVIEVMAETAGAKAGAKASEKSWVVLNRDDDYFDFYLDKVENLGLVTFGFNAEADVRAVDFQLWPEKTKAKIVLSDKCLAAVRQRDKNLPAESELELPYPGKHNLSNALAAAAVGLIGGLPVEEIQNGLKKYVFSAQRNEIQKINGVTIIDDTYNANPDSMAAALEVLALHKSGRRGRLLAVLGEMLELGQAARAAHYKIGAKAAGLGLAQLISVGPLAREIARGARETGLGPEKIIETEQAEEAGEKIAKIIRPGDVVLFKASRVVHLEKAVARLKEGLRSV